MTLGLSEAGADGQRFGVRWPVVGCSPRGARSGEGVDSRPWSRGVPSSPEPKADGGSLKCSHVRRQRQDVFQCILAGPGGVAESETLSLQLSHHHVPAKQQEWLCAWALFGKAALYTVLPIPGGRRIFTYVTIHTGMSGDHRVPCGFQKPSY